MKIVIDENVEKFINKLEAQTFAKVLRIIDLLERFNFKLNLPHSKKIKANFFELRIRGIQEIRIFYTFKKETVILFYVLTKKTQRIPKKEIEQAIKKLNNLT